MQDFPQFTTFGFGALDAAEPCALYAAGGAEFATELLVARQSVVCQRSLGSGGPGAATLSLCGRRLVPGNTATLSVSGASPSSRVFVGISTSANPTSALEGTLLPDPLLDVVPLVADGSGEATLEIPGTRESFTAYLQAVTLTGSGVEITNAIAADFGP